MQYEGAEKKLNGTASNEQKCLRLVFDFSAWQINIFKKKSLLLKDCWLVHQAAAFAFVQHTISPFFHILVQKELSYIVIKSILADLSPLATCFNRE